MVYHSAGYDSMTYSVISSYLYNRQLSPIVLYPPLSPRLRYCPCLTLSKDFVFCHTCSQSLLNSNNKQTSAVHSYSLLIPRSWPSMAQSSPNPIRLLQFPYHDICRRLPPSTQPRYPIIQNRFPNSAISDVPVEMVSDCSEIDMRPEDAQNRVSPHFE